MKGYDQYCPIAHSLGLVGERWTLLVIRELFYGPKRYTDLVAALTGIGTNILAARLKELESNGLISKRKLPPPAASTVYELTDEGRLLRPVLHELVRFGARLIGPPPVDSLQPGWLEHALDLGLSPVSPEGTIAFRVGTEEASIVNGAVVSGIVPDHDLLVEAGPTDFYWLVVEGRRDNVTMDGDPAILDALIDAFAPRGSDRTAALA
ncbi:MAG: winged helix-turn-helix transcriptional regulator [Nocardioidaceae bacterium]